MFHLSRDQRFLLALTGVAATILVVGNMFRPEKSATLAASPPTAPIPEAPFLQRMTLRRSVEDISEYFATLARRLDRYVVRLEKADRSAVLWDDGMLATAADGRRFLKLDRALRSPQSSWRVWPKYVAPHLPTALLETSEEDPPPGPPRYGAGFFTAGGWAVAAWRNPGGDLGYLSGLYLGAARRSCQGVEATLMRTNLALRDDMVGGGVFDVEGALMGVITWCDGRLQVIDVGTIDRFFQQPLIVSERLLARYGFRGEQITELGVRAFGADYGVQVTETWEGWEAAEAGLAPGDVIISVDGAPVTAVPDLEPLVLPVAREVLELVIVRGRQNRRIRLRARPADTPGLSAAGVSWAEPADGFRVAAVEAGGPAALAGLQPGDRLLRLGSARPESVAQINKAITEAGPDNPLFVVVQRGRRIGGAFLGS